MVRDGQNLENGKKGLQMLTWGKDKMTGRDKGIEGNRWEKNKKRCRDERRLEEKNGVERLIEY